MSRVVRASAGNFGQAIAYVGRRAGVAVEVFAAETATPAKVQAMQRLGAAVRTPIPEALFHLRSAVDDIILVSEAQIGRAMRAYFECERLVTEPAGAASLAAAMANAQADRGKAVATLVCGSNIDPRHRDIWLGMSGPSASA